MSGEDKIEQLTASLTREWRYGGRLVLYTLADSNRETVDAYIDTALEMMKQWPQGQPLYTMHDISARNVTLTPYFRKRLDEIADFIRMNNMTGNSAIVLPHTFMNRIFALFAGSFSRRAKLEQRLFTQLEAATAWMDKVMVNEETSVGQSHMERKG